MNEKKIKLNGDVWKDKWDSKIPWRFRAMNIVWSAKTKRQAEETLREYDVVPNRRFDLDVQENMMNLWNVWIIGMIIWTIGVIIEYRVRTRDLNVHNAFKMMWATRLEAFGSLVVALTYIFLHSHEWDGTRTFYMAILTFVFLSNAIKEHHYGKHFVKEFKETYIDN